jgi:hypothetical protein
MHFFICMKMQSLQASGWGNPLRIIPFLPHNSIKVTQGQLFNLLSGVNMHSPQLFVFLHSLGDFLISQNLKENVD